LASNSDEKIITRIWRNREWGRKWWGWRERENCPRTAVYCCRQVSGFEFSVQKYADSVAANWR